MSTSRLVARQFLAIGIPIDHRMQICSRPDLQHIGHHMFKLKYPSCFFWLFLNGLILLDVQQEPQNIAVISPEASSFCVDVSDPVKQGSGLQAFVTYKVSCFRMLQYQELRTMLHLFLRPSEFFVF